MLKTGLKLKNTVYLGILAVALVFSLYSLFSENAKSWFMSNKEITLSPLYGRVLTSGAGRNLTSFKNNDPGNLNLIIVDEAVDETANIRMVPGDMVHFVFLVSLPDPALFDNGDLVLNGIYGDEKIRALCKIAASSIQVSAVNVTEIIAEGQPVYSYEHSQTWQTLENAAAPDLLSPGNELGIPLGECGVTGVMAETGPYDGLYLFLVDVPALYIDTGENQNDQKCDYENIPGVGWVPVEDAVTGALIIERCLIVH